MADIPLDNGESLPLADGAVNGDPFASINVLANAVANLLKKRERFDYTWADSSERGAETGMVQGSRGYQEDTQTEYLYNSSVWRLALPWAEFTASVTAGDTAPSAPQPVGVFTLDAAQSTDSTFVTVSTSGLLTLTRAGIYHISTTTDFGAPITGRTFVEVLVSAGQLERSGSGIAETLGSLSTQVRAAAAGTVLTLNYYKETGGSSTVTTRARISRIG